MQQSRALPSHVLDNPVAHSNIQIAYSLVRNAEVAATSGSTDQTAARIVGYLLRELYVAQSGLLGSIPLNYVVNEVISCNNSPDSVKRRIYELGREYRDRLLGPCKSFLHPFLNPTCTDDFVP